MNNIILFIFIVLINILINLFLINKKNKKYYGELKFENDELTLVLNNDDFDLLKNGDIVSFIVSRK